MKAVASFSLTFLALAMVAIITSCGGSSPILNQSISIISVSVSAGANSVEATGGDSIIATVTGDSSNKGVTWSVSCTAGPCGTITSNAPTPPNMFNATYTAPPAPPASDLAVTVKATSVADPSKSATTTVTVSAITLALNISGTGVTASTATTATVQVGTGNFVQINASVNNDPSNQGVKFTISPTSQASSLMIQDPFDATFNSPSTPPAASLLVTVTAASVEDSTKSVTLTITVPSVTISISPNSATVDAQGTVNVTATVGNDSSGKGVTWAVQPCGAADCGSIPGTATLSGSPATYTAPATPPDPGDLTVTVTATSVADSSAQASMMITVKAISVTVTPSNANVLFGTTLSNIIATVNDDPAKKGVTWALQPCGVTDCGSISSNATASGKPITYTAPASPPASDVSVTIVATSDSDTTQTNSISITVPAITVSLSPSSAIIPVNATAALNATPFTPNVSHDSSAQVNVNWTLTQNGTTCTTAVCGMVSPATTGNNQATIYAAPSSVPPNSSVTITATSATDNTKSASATITLTAGVVKLIPATLNFGSLKISPFNPRPTSTLTETLTNAGGSALHISNQATTGSSAFSITTLCQGALATSVGSGGSCNIRVKFAPASVGSFNGNLVITDDDTSGTQQISLSGKACSRFRPCTGSTDFRSALARNQVAAAPSPSGSSRVGTQTLDLVDAGRSDPFLANGAKRELMVRLWYPANVGKDCQLAEYTSPGVWNYLSRLVRVSAPKVKTNSCKNAAVASGAHPLVVFTHGYTGTFTDYTFLFEDLASRGYVVASVNHTFEATATQFPDGRLAKSVIGTHFEDEMNLDADETSFAVAVRLADLKFVLDELAHLNASRIGPFASKLDMSRVAVAGHSLGGMTALLGLKLEPRFHAAISIDGVTPGSLFGSTQKPVLVLFAGRDWDQNACRLWDGLHGPRLALNLRGSEHLTPSDAVWLASGAVKTGTVGVDNTVAAMRNYIAAFLDANLKGGGIDPLLRGSSTNYPDVEVMPQTASPCGNARNSAHE